MKSLFSTLIILSASCCALMACNNGYVAATLGLSLLAICHAADNQS